MKKAMIIVFVILLFCCGCTSNLATRLSAPLEPTAAPVTRKSSLLPKDIKALRGTFFDFGIDNRLDYVPVFDEGKAPSSSAEYLYYAFAINLEKWGNDKGTMTRDYVEQVIRTHFQVENITHAPLRKGWDYDGEKYTAIPQGIKENPIYVLQKFSTHIKNGRIVYEITLENCSFGDVLPDDEDIATIRAGFLSGDLSALTVLQTECFQYYLDQTTGAVVFLSHTIQEQPTSNK